MIKTKGYYFGEYEVLTANYAGPDFSRRCFIFPGQGSNFPGMFRDEYGEFKEIRDKFALADSLARNYGLPKISNYVLNPESLKKEIIPQVANLALFTLECALFDIFVLRKIIPRVLTGHSFGEYAAISCAGIIPFEEMFDIVYRRDNFCRPPHEAGIMLAVNAGAEKVKAVLKNEEYYLSNFNSPKQTAVSVPTANVDEISKILDAEKIRHKVLENVPQPYHSPYLNPVAEKISEYLKTAKVSFQKPSTPLFSSVLKKKINKDNFDPEDIKEILVKQIITPVDFINQIKSIYASGCFNFLELGGKKVFSSFIEDILAGEEFKTELASVLLQNGKKAVSKSLSREDSRFFALISGIIGKITGYEVEKISIEDKFQEDLGIDSIKKADILFTVLGESNINPGEDFNTSEFIRVGDIVLYLEKAEKGILPKSAGRARPTNFKRYVFVPAEMPLRIHSQRDVQHSIFNIEDILKSKDAVLEKLVSFFEKTYAGRPVLIFRADEIEADFDKIFLLFKFFREFARVLKTDNFDLILLSFGGGSGGQANPFVQCLASFLKSFKKELPGVFFKHTHFAAAPGEKKEIETALKEAAEPFGVDVLYKNGKRYVLKPRLARLAKKRGLKLNNKSVVLAVGGAKGITFSLVKHISKKYKPVIYLAGRSPWKNPEVSANVKELKKNNKKIFYESADARDAKAMEDLFAKINKKRKKIDLVINGAGTVKIGFLKAKTDEDIDYEFNNKVLPAFNVLNLSHKYRPKRIINFSSIISEYGSAGQTIYTSANALVSGLTEKSGLPATTVHFPPWDALGMTGDKGVLQKLKEYGVSLLEAKKADELFAFDISSPETKPVYYLDESDDLFYGFPLNNLAGVRSLIGELSDSFGISVSRPVFEKNFDLSKDVYLKDHTIEGASYVPAAVGIGMFLCLGNMNLKKFPVLKNISIQNPVIVKTEPVKCLFAAEANGGAYNFSVKSNVPHFSGVAVNKNPKRPGQRILPAPEKEIARDSIYSDYYFKDSLYLGPTFREIDRAFVDKSGNVFVSVDNSKLPPVLGLGIYDKLIQWTDALFQTLGAVALKENFKMIPVKVGRLEFYSDAEISDILYAIPSNVRFTKDGLEGDVALVNEKGKMILEASRVFIKKIGEYAESKLEIKNYQD
ncbi:MAG: SDR family NAD(P)-dependent oxidoreductase [Candidatus Paceibacterota bacterium]